jgi:ribonucleoside-diphosphate reductase alpha chain
MYMVRNLKKNIQNYEKAGKGRKKIKAHELWEKFLESQIETGTPICI